MYDFATTEPRRSGESTPSLAKPPLLLTAAEVARVAVEYPSSLVVDALTPRRRVGAGLPVLVLPGISAHDALTARLRGHLRSRGYRPHGWQLGRNHGLTDALVDGVEARLVELHERHQQPVIVVGWSFGGLFARWLAHEHPDAVRQVVCLGSAWRAEGERTRSTVLFERLAARHGLSERARDIVATLREPMPVTTTAIFSRTDGIVNWRACALPPGEGQNIAVPSSHVGLVSNPLALAALEDRLAQDPVDPQPFDWATCLKGSVLGLVGTGVGTGQSPAGVA
jgi:pimeloyl-ACP methyl ester carboxylesterase